MDLRSIADSYRRVFRPRAERELSWFAEQPDLATALDLATRAENTQGKRYSHQRRIPKSAMFHARQILLSAHDLIQESGSFAELYHRIEQLVGDIHGIGPLYVYDTSLRVGAYMRLSPERIYLHTGTRIGARNLGLPYQKDSLSLSELPAAFRKLEPFEIEDILCIFKDKVGPSYPPKDFDELWDRSSCA